VKFIAVILYQSNFESHCAHTEFYGIRRSAENRLYVPQHRSDLAEAHPALKAMCLSS